jgi:hypothetical protein
VNHEHGYKHTRAYIRKFTVIHGGNRGDTVIKVLRYKSGGRWFDSRWCYWNFSFT